MVDIIHSNAAFHFKSKLSFLRKCVFLQTSIIHSLLARNLKLAAKLHFVEKPPICQKQWIRKRDVSFEVGFL